MTSHLSLGFYASFALAFALLFYAVGPQEVLTGLVGGPLYFASGSHNDHATSGSAAGGSSGSSGTSSSADLTLYNLNKLPIWFGNHDGAADGSASPIKTFLENELSNKILLASGGIIISSKGGGAGGEIKLELKDKTLEVVTPCSSNPPDPSSASRDESHCTKASELVNNLVAFVLDETREVPKCETGSTMEEKKLVCKLKKEETLPSVPPTPGGTPATGCSFKITVTPGTFKGDKEDKVSFTATLQPFKRDGRDISTPTLKDAAVRLTIALVPMVGTGATKWRQNQPTLYKSFCSHAAEFPQGKENTDCDNLDFEPADGGKYSVLLSKIVSKVEKIEETGKEKGKTVALKFIGTGIKADGTKNTDAKFQVGKDEHVKVIIYARQWVEVTENSNKVKKYCSTREEKPMGEWIEYGLEGLSEPSSAPVIAPPTTDPRHSGPTSPAGSPKPTLSPGTPTPTPTPTPQTTPGTTPPATSIPVPPAATEGYVKIDASSAYVSKGGNNYAVKDPKTGKEYPVLEAKVTEISLSGQPLSNFNPQWMSGTSNIVASVTFPVSPVPKNVGAGSLTLKGSFKARAGLFTVAVVKELVHKDPFTVQGTNTKENPLQLVLSNFEDKDKRQALSDPSAYFAGVFSEEEALA